ncbi:hypothetical protein Y032_0180g762 [Ancylostoma ceylanicum]|nr:hypothetical protein Y032_0180g762 [Ancylostoma ceylanicum]
MASLLRRMYGQNSLLFQCDVSPCCSELYAEFAKSPILGDLASTRVQLLGSPFHTFRLELFLIRLPSSSKLEE